MSNVVRFRLLGSIELHGSDGRAARAVLAQSKRLAVLAYLAASPGKLHRRDTLLALFWPEFDESRARGALNQALRFLRRGLGPGIIVSSGDEMVCVDDGRLWSDVAALRRHVDAGEFAEALALYRGELLAGLHLDDCHDFDEWLERERVALRSLAANAARAVAGEQEAGENFTTAIASARRAVELSVDDERVVRELLLMLDRLGDRAGALHAYEEFAARLSAEFDAAPSAETIDIIERIRSRAAAPAVLPSDQPRWEMVRELGRGGMSTVFLAKDSKHDRFVAVKTLRPELARRGVERFLREIQITARLAHPHILPLIDSGVVDGQLQLVTPYVAGESLRDRLRRDPRLTIDEAVQVAVEIAEALDYAHRLGVVHRDIKPENILLADGHAIVADFGIARALASSGASTIPDSDPVAVVGSRAYMSPEQVADAPGAGPRADLYALGVVLYEMLIGSLPAPAVTSAEIIRRRPGLSPALASIVASCLASREVDRPEHAGDVLQALRAVIRGSSDAPRRRRTIVWASIAASVVGVAGIAAVYRPPGDPVDRLTATDTRLVAGSTDMELDPVISPDGKRVAYATGRGFLQMRIAVRSLDGGSPTVVSGALGGTHRWPRWSPDGSRILFGAFGRGVRPGGYVVSAAGGSPELIIRNDRSLLYEQATTPAWSRDGKRLVYSLSDRIVVRDYDGSAETVVATGSQLHSPVLSPDGKYVAYVAGNAFDVQSFNNAASSVCIARLEAPSRPTCITDHTHSNGSPAWLHDGRGLVFVSNSAGEGDLYQQRLSSSMQPLGAPVRLTTGLSAHSVALSANDDRAVYSVVRIRSRIWAAQIGNSPASLASLVPISNESEAIEGLDVTRDGKWLAFDSDRSGTQHIYKMAAAGGPPIQITTDSGPNLIPRWSPDGKSIAYYSIRRGNRDIYVISAEGKHEEAVTSGPLEEGSPGWSPDGNQISFITCCGSPPGLYVSARATTGWSRPRQIVAAGVGQIPSWSPDGRWIAHVEDGSGQKLYIVAPNGGERRAVSTDFGLVGGVNGVMWGPDPRTLYVRAVKGGVASFWSIPVAGGPPHLLLRLDDSTHYSRRQEFTSDGRRLYFTLSADAADVWMMNLKRGR